MSTTLKSVIRIDPSKCSAYLADSNRFFPLLYFPASTATTSSRTPPSLPRTGEWGEGSGEWYRRTIPLEDASKHGLVTTHRTLPRPG